MGLSHELEVNQTYMELVSELSVFLNDRMWEPKIAIRSSDGGGIPEENFRFN